MPKPTGQNEPNMQPVMELDVTGVTCSAGTYIRALGRDLAPNSASAAI